MVRSTSSLRSAQTETDASSPQRVVGQKAQLGLLLRRLYQKNQTIFTARCLQSRITSVQTASLAILADEGPMSLAELGVAAAMDPATTRGVVERLRAQSLIHLLKDPQDKRKVIVELTRKGRDYIHAMAPVIEAILDETLHPLNTAERLAFEFLLRKLVESEEAQQSSVFAESVEPAFAA